MSEEILKALTQLFAIITKQDGGVTETERNFVINFFEQELDQDSINEYLELYDKSVGYGTQQAEEKSGEVKNKGKKLTSVKDSVKTLAICKKINKTLTQKQKVVVLIKLLELVGSDRNFTSQRMEIIDTVSTVFNIIRDEFRLIESFVLQELSDELNFDDILAVNDKNSEEDVILTTSKKQLFADINGEIIFMQVKSVEMYFVKYVGKDEIVLNGFIMKPKHVYLFSHGSTIKTPKGIGLYYSDLISHFLSGFKTHNISFNAVGIEFRFPNGGIGLRDVNISEGPGRLIGIMGASGAGKTTLLNVLAGIEKPSKGAILINGYNINSQKEQIQGVIGYVSQDDLLIEELTVYQNLYYNAKLCFANLSPEELHKRVMDVLSSLGLEQRKDLKVGSVLDKTISGGQRKRLNIALELIREPAVMFVDEPTSGLSSRDSENVIDLLKELSLKGKLIFVVIHQPSSDIYKMFDKMFIMDTGGYPIFYGNPIEAVTYFKRSTNQVDSERGQCPTCGNVNPEQIFNIIEAKVVDEYGQLTNKRKVNPARWNELYISNFNLETIEDIKEAPPQNLMIPSKIKQAIIFTTRDTLAKISSFQYLLVNLLEAPVLAFILAFIIKYRSSGNGESYVYRFNENIPAYMLMSIIVALFMGLSVSAEEIIRDRKILRRESFLNLSWNSYLLSKFTILFALSAIQTLSFVLIGNLLLQIKGVFLSYWLVLFSVSCFANMLGLNISSAFKSAVTVYILIPLLLIPQMILSGLLFPFDKLNHVISAKGKVPIVADMMASRWAYEAMAVDQFKKSYYKPILFDLTMEESSSDFKSGYLIPKLRAKLEFAENNLDTKNDSIQNLVSNELIVIINALKEETFKEGISGLNLTDELVFGKFNKAHAKKLKDYFDKLETHYLDQFNLARSKQDRVIMVLEDNKENHFDLNHFMNTYYNESLSDLVRNIGVKERILEHDGKLIQQIDPIFSMPKQEGFFNYRTSFFAPLKPLFNKYFDTFNFNLSVIWLMTLLLYLALYFELLTKLLGTIGKLSVIKKKEK